ncbi:MAG: NTP transferase domain-containing protein [Pseudomonadota bacterium]
MTKATALILAASRRGPEDAVAKLQGVSHKCLIEIDGMVMLERVVREIMASDHIDRIFVSIESEDLLKATPALAAMLANGEIQFTPSKDNLFLSITEGAGAIEDPFPLVISTGDNALHTTEMVDFFCEELLSSESDVLVAMTPADVILKAYPDGKRAFHELRDGGWSSCNLYGLQSERALGAAKAFETGGQFGKQPQRIAEAFGLSFMAKYKFKLATLDQLAEHLSRRWDIILKPVRMPFADAPIDVDNPGDFQRSEAILKARRGAGELA